MSTESTPRTSRFGSSRRSRRNTPRSPHPDLSATLAADPVGQAPSPDAQSAVLSPGAQAGPAAQEQPPPESVPAEAEPDPLTAEQTLLALLGVFDKIDSNKTGAVNRDAILSYLESERRVKALTFEEQFQREPDYDAAFENFFGGLDALSEMLGSSSAPKVTFAEFEIAVQVLALQHMFESAVGSSGDNLRDKLLQCLQESFRWDPEGLSGAPSGGGLSCFQARCEVVHQGLGQGAHPAVTWEECLALYEQAILKGIFQLCTRHQGPEVRRQEFTALLRDSEVRERLSVLGRFRRRAEWTLDTEEIADTIGSIEHPELSWAECEWHIAMAALSSVWFRTIDPDQTNQGQTARVLSIIQSNNYAVMRQELGSLLRLWQMDEHKPRFMRICADMRNAQESLWIFSGQDGELQAPARLGAELSWDWFVDLMSSEYQLRAPEPQQAEEAQGEDVPSLEAISKFLCAQSGGVCLEEEDEEEHEWCEVDWMTEDSPEVRRWGEMAAEYNTEPSEIAFLQSIAQLSAAHRLEAASPVKMVPAHVPEHPGSAQLSCLTEPAPPARNPRTNPIQRPDYSAHLERDQFHEAQPYAFTGTHERAPRSTKPARKESVRSARQALNLYYQPLPGPTKPSQACMMALPEPDQRSVSAHWRLRQRSMTADWSHRRRLCSSRNAKRSVGDAKITKMGEASSFLNYEHVSTGAVGFGLSQHTPRMPRNMPADCAVHCYGTHRSPRQPVDPAARRQIVASHESSRGGKHIGTQSRQPVYSFGHSKREPTVRGQPLGPGAYLPQ